MQVGRSDDLSIKDDEILWRRIVPSVVWIPRDENGAPNRREDGSIQVSSAVFRDGRTNEVSVHRACMTSIDVVLKGYPDQGLLGIHAGTLRSLNYILVHDPTKDDHSHALICVPKSISSKQIKEKAREVAKRAFWVVIPDMK